MRRPRFLLFDAFFLPLLAAPLGGGVAFGSLPLTARPEGRAGRESAPGEEERPGGGGLGRRSVGQCRAPKKKRGLKRPLQGLAASLRAVAVYAADRTE